MIHLTLKDERKNRTMGETSMDFDVSKEDVRLLAGSPWEERGKSFLVRRNRIELRNDHCEGR